MALSRSEYRVYITSSLWRDKHQEWLKQVGYQCPVSFKKVGKGGKYNCHHTNYKRLGEEIFFLDIIPLNPWVHKNIVHGVLSGWKPAGQQKHYPNAPQRIFHNYCRMMLIVQALLRIIWRVTKTILRITLRLLGVIK